MILILTQCFPPDIGGIENLMGGLADNLYRAGHNVVVCADAIRGLGKTREFPYRVLRFGGPRPLRRWRKRRAVSELARQMPLQATFMDSWKSIEAMPKIGVPTFTLAHGTEFPVKPSPRKRARIEAALACSTRIIASSHYSRQKVEAFVPSGRDIEVIYPPIEQQTEPAASALENIDRQIAGRKPVLVTLSRLEPRKGVDRAIEAVAELKGVFPDILYCVAGGGDDRERLEGLTKTLGLEKSVRFLGRVSDEQKAALLSRADLFVMPTRREGNSVEGFGISYIEAAWYGVPSLAGSEGGGAEAVRNKETGLVCDGDDQTAVTDAIARLLKDDALRAKLGEAAAKRVRNELQWSQAIKRYLALIEI